MSKKTGKILLIVLLVTFITILHYRTALPNISSHIIFRELYYFPIILAGFWFGIYGGTGTSLSVTLVYLPFILTHPGGLTGHNFGNLTQIILFNVFGFIIGLLSDRQRKQQKILLEAENLAAMGKAASCIAHDMKTPLMIIGGSVQQARRTETDSSRRKKLDLAFGQVRRLEVLVGDILAFAKPLNLQRQSGNLNQLIDETVSFCREKAALHMVSLAIEPEENVPPAAYDHNRMQQVLQNLIDNAVEASPAGANVIIRSSFDAKNIIVEVSDYGTGIPGDQEEIFVPFVTSKREGTGLGLAIVKKIITAHAGTIKVAENRPRGTTFRITLPLGETGRGEEPARNMHDHLESERSRRRPLPG